MVELIAEIGINHNGDMAIAKKLIDVAAAAGCQYVKLQKRTVNLVYTKEELAAVRESPFGNTNGDLKRGLEFGLDDYCEIDQHCAERGIGWFASPWDIESVKFLAGFPSCAFLKIPSALLTNHNLLRLCAATGKPIILSTGMSTTEEIKMAVAVLGHSISCIMHCTSTYPSRPEELNLKCLRGLSSAVGAGVKLGFSNHSPGLIYMPVAVALGAEMIEFHITLDRSMWG